MVHHQTHHIVQPNPTSILAYSVPKRLPLPHQPNIIPIWYYERNSRAKGIIILSRTENACGRLALARCFICMYKRDILSFAFLFCRCWKGKFRLRHLPRVEETDYRLALNLYQQLYTEQNVTLYCPLYNNFLSIGWLGWNEK